MRFGERGWAEGAYGYWYGWGRQENFRIPCLLRYLFLICTPLLPYIILAQTPHLAYFLNFHVTPTLLHAIALSNITAISYTFRYHCPKNEHQPSPVGI